MKKLKYFILFSIIIFGFLPRTITVYGASNQTSIVDTVILSDPNDPYYSLAIEISETEKIEIYSDHNDAFLADPTFLLWVVSPENLSEEKVFDFSNALIKYGSTISIGIISGENIDDARKIWKGHTQIPTETAAIINGKKASKVDHEIRIIKTPEEHNLTFTKENILLTLSQIDIVQISMEGTAKSWFDQSSETSIRSSDLPNQLPSIIQFYGCDTFRPWEENSIAIEAIHKGAIAYLGFVHSSVTGTRFGDYSEITLMNSWKEFPIGHLVQIQNQAAMQSYTKLPHFFMLGDPRIFVRETMPYTIIEDKVVENTRKIILSDVENGIIPIFIENGSGYDYVQVTGLTSTTTNNKFLNSQLQTLNIGLDKYIAIQNTHDSIELILKKSAPLSYYLTNYPLNFIDSIFVDVQGSIFPIILAVPVFILLLIGAIKKKYTLSELTNCFVLGGVMATGAIIYFLIRKEQINITNIPVTINWYFIVGIFMFTSYGALIFKGSQKIGMSIVAILVANINNIFTSLIFGLALIIKLVLFGSGMDINKPGYPLMDVLLRVVVGFIFYYFLFTLFKSGKRKVLTEDG